MKKTDFLEDRAEKEDCLVTSDSTDFFVVIHDWLLERGDVTEGDKKEHLEGFDDNRRKTNRKLDPVGSTVRYEVMRLCTGSVYDSNGRHLVVLSQ